VRTELSPTPPLYEREGQVILTNIRSLGKQLLYYQLKPENYLTPSVLKNPYAVRKQKNKSSKKSWEGCQVFNDSDKPEWFFPNNALPFSLIHALPNTQFGGSVQEFHFCLRSLDLIQLAQQLSSLFGKNNQSQCLFSPGNHFKICP